MWKSLLPVQRAGWLSIIIYIFAATGDKIERKEGIAMIGAYILYMIYAVSRGMGWI